jgi:spermidine/putrescine transport system ATP-binding protein
MKTMESAYPNPSPEEIDFNARHWLTRTGWIVLTIQSSAHIFLFSCRYQFVTRMAVQSENPSAVQPHAVIPAIEAHGLVRQFGTVKALDDVSITIRKGEFFSLLGPSGCGKTTLLRLIAGLDIPDAGTLIIDGTDAEDIPAHKRPVNTVFQSYALFPHLTVQENVAFGLRMKKVAAAQIRERVERAMAMVQISELAARRPGQLSGGQKQRVALARALVNEPAVLLLDEPLGALDLKLRKQLQVELHHLQRRLGITFIYVTHDQEEALVMSDRIAVMNAGRIEQLDNAEELYERPNTRFVAQFLGSCNLIEGTVSGTDAKGFRVRSALGNLRVVLPPASPDNASARARLKIDGPVTLAIRPEKMHLAKKDELPFENCVTARIEDLVYSGAETQYRLRAGDLALSVVALNARAGHQGFHPGRNVLCYLPEQALILLDD